jgi:tetratricopeptide (TPR) repeat protein
MATYADRDADRMISGFAWRRRLRNFFGLLFGALLLAMLAAFVFEAELPELDWASKSVRALIEDPAPPAAVAQADEADGGIEAADAGAPEEDAGSSPPPPTEEGTSAMARGRRLLEEGDPMKALLAFEEASERAPDSPDARYYMGVSYVQLGKYDVAQDHFRGALELDASHVPSVYGMADALRLNAEIKEAAKWYRRYLELSPRGRYAVVASRAIDAFED